MSDPTTADQSCPSCKGTGNSGYVRNIINADGTRTWEYLPCFCIRWPFAPPPDSPCTCVACDARRRVAELEAENAAERALADQLAKALIEGPFRGDRRFRMYGSDWDAVHTALAAWEARRG